MPTGPQRPRPKMSEQARLKGAATRASRQVDRIDQEYGSANIPLDHPLYEKRKVAKDKHMQAMAAYRESTA